MESHNLRYHKIVPTIQVKTLSAQYPVQVGVNLLPALGRRIKKFAGSRRIFVLTSPTIWSLWGKQFLSSFPKDQQPTTLFLPPGEQHKRLAQIERLAAELSTSGA